MAEYHRPRRRAVTCIQAGAGLGSGASRRRPPPGRAEEVTTTHGEDLEVFVEKRFGQGLSLRLAGSNLLDAAKRKYFNTFDNAADQQDRDFDEYEVEKEPTGRCTSG